ncbi:hypothetical protein L6R34_27130, partial [Escherichia coli]|nr:hypothetical protein [Escherichia coli]
MEVLNAPGKYQYDLRNHLLVDLFPIALDAEITTSNVNKHQLHRSNIPATLSGNSSITGYVPFSAERNAARVIWRTPHRRVLRFKSQHPGELACFISPVA